MDVVKAKVGNDNRNVEDIMGTHGLGNSNGDTLIELSSSYRLIIGGTLFPHKNLHKAAWESPDSTKNQIVLIMISKKWRISLQIVHIGEPMSPAIIL